MDAKPQRPTARVLRIHDENMPPATANGLSGKTLHQRTKSTSALNSAATLQGKKVLGEANANARLGPKDDSEVGKVSPGKMRLTQDTTNPAPTAASFHRPAVRPLGAKAGFSQNTYAPSNTAAGPTDSQVAKKVVPKKSKILRDVLPVSNTDTVPGTDSAIAVQPPQATAEPPARQNAVPQLQEVYRVESIPLRDEALPRQPVQLSTTALNSAVSSTAAHFQYLPQPSQAEILQQPLNGVSTVIPYAHQVLTPPAEQDELVDEYDDADQDYMTAQSFDLPGDATHTTIFNPLYTKRHKAEIAEAKAWVELNRTPDDIEDELWDTSMVAEYGEEIFEYMRVQETKMSPTSNYMDQQTEIQWSMRGVLMDWVVQVHQRFNLLPETLFLTVNYIDRFLSCKIVSLGKLQLVGATAIFVAAKYEEVNCPTISEIIYMVDNGYTADELLKAERFMLSMLQFELGWPGPMSFLRRISKADDYDLETRTLAKYFLEVTIMDERFVACKPSFLAAGAHCMARLMLRKGDWTKAHVYYSDYTFRQLHRLLAAIYDCCSDGQKHHAAVFEKYTDKRYKRASTFVHGEMVRGFQLPFSCRAGSLGPQVTATNWLGQ